MEPELSDEYCTPKRRIPPEELTHIIKELRTLPDPDPPSEDDMDVEDEELSEEGYHDSETIFRTNKRVHFRSQVYFFNEVYYGNLAKDFEEGVEFYAKTFEDYIDIIRKAVRIYTHEETNTVEKLLMGLERAYIHAGERLWHEKKRVKEAIPDFMSMTGPSKTAYKHSVIKKLLALFMELYRINAGGKE